MGRMGHLHSQCLALADEASAALRNEGEDFEHGVDGEGTELRVYADRRQARVVRPGRLVDAGAHEEGSGSARLRTELSGREEIDACEDLGAEVASELRCQPAVRAAAQLVAQQRRAE